MLALAVAYMPENSAFGGAGGGGVDNWILRAGAWRDAGIWIDSDVWKDS